MARTNDILEYIRRKSSRKQKEIFKEIEKIEKADSKRRQELIYEHQQKTNVFYKMIDEDTALRNRLNEIVDNLGLTLREDKTGVAPEAYCFVEPRVVPSEEDKAKHAALEKRLQLLKDVVVWAEDECLLLNVRKDAEVGKFLDDLAGKLESV